MPRPASRIWTLTVAGWCLVCVCYCSAQQPAAPHRFDRETILRNMPMNSDLRCTGISLVAEALLEGEALEGAVLDTPEELGKKIYESSIAGRKVAFHRQLSVDGIPLPIESLPALNRLSTIVADLFKDEFVKLTATESGKQKVLAAQHTFVRSTRDLDRILAADPDRIVAFLLIGERTFADGTIKDTAHAALFGKSPEAQLIVYDPNEPGRAIPCSVQETDQGLAVEWRCTYRDTGHFTSQTYFLVEKRMYFRLSGQHRG